VPAFEIFAARRSGRGRLGNISLLLGGAAICIPAVGDRAEAQAPVDPSQQEIIVYGPSLFRDVIPERDLDEESISAYGESTIDGLLSELQQELGEDEQPLILVNGERLNDLDQIGALPVEALRNVRILPRGSAVRAGGRSGQRVISLTLKPTTRSATLVAAPKIATEGDWHGERGEAIATYIRGTTRANLTLRGRRESGLLESDRDIIQPTPRLPYALSGNVIGFPDTDGEIDPLLSALAGRIVTIAPIPDLAAPTLDDFAIKANDPAVTDIGAFRTLRPRVRNFDFNGTFGARLTSWLTGTATVRLGRNNSRSKRGLPQALFVLSPDNPASPFSDDVGLAFFGRTPLIYRSRRDSGELNVTLNARLGKWTSNFNARHLEARDVSRNQRSALFGSTLLADEINPFASDLSDLILVRSDTFKSRSIADHIVWSATGPAVTLPAGDLQATIEGRLVWARQRSESSFSPDSERNYRRAEQSIRAAVDIPLTSRANNFLAEVGDLSATAEYSRVHFSDAGTLNNHALGLTWEPSERLRLRAEIEKFERPASVQLLANPTIVSPDVRVFDPLTGQTVDVVQITGGIRTLDPETSRIRRLSGQWTAVPKLNLQLNAEYTDTDQRDFLSSLPEASAAVMIAFPDRFVRNANGELTTIDLRPVNFESHREKRFRYGFSLNTGLGGGERMPVKISASADEDGVVEVVDREPASRAPSVRRPPTRLQLSASHTIVLSDNIVIRPGLDPVNLLRGGAIGIAGGRVRHQLDGSGSLTSGGMGTRLAVTWRGKSALETRIDGQCRQLHFSPILSVNVCVFANASRISGSGN